MKKVYRYLFDTNLISSLLNDKDINHKNAINQFNKIKDPCKLFVPNTVLLELASQKFIKFKRILDFISATQTQINDLNYGDILEISKLTSEEDITLKPIDLSVLYCTKKYNASLLTFDKKLLKEFKKLKLHKR